MKIDYLQKFMFEDLPIKGCFVRLERSWKEVQQRVQPKAEEKQLLGQALCAAALLGSSIKFDGTVSLQVQSAGALSLLLAQCTNQNVIRGICRSNPDQQERQHLLENAILAINLEPENRGTPYQGIVSMAEGKLEQALEQYFSQSEQLKTHFWLVAGSKVCAGLMIQKMPENQVSSDDFNRIIHLASTLKQRELIDLEPEKLLHLLFSEDTLRLFDSEPLKFGCRCSSERVSGVLKSLGKAELDSLLEEQGEIEVHCEYCGQSYRFDSVDMANLFAGQAMLIDASPGLH